MSLKFSHTSVWPPQDDAIRSALLAAYSEGSWGKYHGPNWEALRAMLSQMMGVEHVYPCSSGTIAVELGLRGGRIGPGDEVLLAGYDFPAFRDPRWQQSTEYDLALQFLYDSGNDADRMLMLGRMMTSVLGVALGLLVKPAPVLLSL